MLAVSPNPFAVFIAFIAGDDHHRTHGWGLTRGFENIHRAHHIRGISLDGFLIRAQHQGLGRRMKDNLWTALLEQLQDRSKIADIPEDRIHALPNLGIGKKAGRATLGGQCQAADLAAHGFKPRGQPPAFETGVARDHN